MIYKPWSLGGRVVLKSESIPKQLLIQGTIFASLMKFYACKKFYARGIRFGARKKLVCNNKT